MSLVEKIDLGRHAVVEASAGTGKTYTIEQLVLRLLLEQRATLDQILLVTFTEKATGELKGRLRSAIEKRLKEERALAAILQPALDSFDQAPIFTIHGFCHRLLSEYPVEQGQELGATLVDKQVLIEPALREVQRRVWRQQFGEQLQRVLELARFQRSSAERWERKVLEIAAQYQPECHHVLLPAAEGGLNLEKQEQACRHLLANLRARAGPAPQLLPTHQWIVGLEDVQKVHGGFMDRVDKFLMPLLHWLYDAAADQEALASYTRFEGLIAAEFEEAFAEQGFACFFDGVQDEARAAVPVACPGLQEALAALDAFRGRGALEGLSEQLAVFTIRKIHEHLEELKGQRGWITYDDMVAQVARGLDPASSGARGFARLLRQRFRFGIVDEFQDTDPLQWLIFRRIFLEEGTSRLVVVGDPKQAIFGFRGADLPTYLSAVREMVDRYSARRYPLTINWRTIEPLLRALNHLFEQSAWFEHDHGIAYLEAQAPPAAQRRVSLEHEPVPQPPLALFNLSEEKYAKQAQRKFARFAAEEVRRLVDSGLEYICKGERKKLTAGDICLLVFKRKEGDPLEEELRRVGIPYTFYRQPGLWQSEEAQHLAIVLEALAHPGDRVLFRKALLTRFFRTRPGDLACCDELPAAHPSRALFQRWLGFSERRQWSSLFQSLLEETGILVADLESRELDRRAANLKHLTSALEEAAYGGNLDLLDLLDLFKSRQVEGEDPQADVQPIETEQPKVKIMTVHASKGLEFPVVFLCGGFTTRPDELSRYRDSAGRRVFDLQPDAQAKLRHKEERLAEFRRLLYVAMTRAMCKLYIPHLSPDCGKNAVWCGPLITLLAPALAQANPAVLGKAYAGHWLKRTVVGKKPAAAAQETETPRRASLLPDGVLFPVLDPSIGRRRLVVRSFTSMRRLAARQRLEGPHFGDELPRADDEDVEQAASVDPLRGAAFGEIVHEALEKIDFAAVGQAADEGALLVEGSTCRAVLDAAVNRHLAKIRSRTPAAQLAQACRQMVARLIWHALHTPLQALGGPLWRIPPEDRLAELEFLLPENFGDTATPNIRVPSIRVPDVRVEEGFFTGFMDLVVRRGDQYFLIDWKTNLLEDYTPAGVAQAMTEADYQRQYGLYLQALERWIRRLHGNRTDPARHVGGVYYLFLRGLNGRDETSGVFFHRPEGKRREGSDA